MDVATGDNGREAKDALFAAAKAEATMPSEQEGPSRQTPLSLEVNPPPSVTGMHSSRYSKFINQGNSIEMNNERLCSINDNIAIYSVGSLLTEIHGSISSLKPVR